MARRAQADREELVERIGRVIREDGTVEPMKGLQLHRFSSPKKAIYGMYGPGFCVIAQGSKEILLGDHRYHYDPAHYLLATVELPVVSQVLEASIERPHLSLCLSFDPALVGSVMAEAKPSLPEHHTDVKAIDTSPLDAPLLDSVVRLVRLLDSPAEARVLGPLVMREIVHRLLMGEQGGRLSHLALVGDSSQRVGQAIERLSKEFDQILRIDSIAQDLGMSVSGFHSHFKAVTGLSPLQFQKQIRLQESRRLMLGEGINAASAAYRVGYNDSSHFNREYKTLFGASPMRDVERLREAARIGNPL